MFLRCNQCRNTNVCHCLFASSVFSWFSQHCFCRSSGTLTSVRSRKRHQGLTLLELMIAMTIMVMIVGTLGVMANGIQQSYEYTDGHGTATQHARVVLERIGRTVRKATANEQFPGAIVVSESIGPWQFPDVLVVWRPDGDPAAPDGLPQFNELVIYCTDSQSPNRLVELTIPSDTRPVPKVDEQSQWQSDIAAIRQTGVGESVTLTKLLRSCSVTDSLDSSSQLRGSVRFQTRVRPSMTCTLDWKDKAWVQNLYTSQTGLRQVWVGTELQLVPKPDMSGGEESAYRPIVFFGSEAIYYMMRN